MSQMELGVTFPERYSNFFKFFSDSSKSTEEIKSFISINSLKNYSCSYNIVHLNMIDPKNLNILFHIVRKSKSDKECLEKLMLLIVQYNINYNAMDFNQRTLPFYTCVKGYLNSTKYLLDKMDYDIASRDNKGETLFFSAIRSYNIELVKFLDNKYKKWIYFPNNEYSSCIFNIFKKSMKDEGEIKIKNLLKFIVEKGFDIEQKNCNNVSFKDLCASYKIDNYLNDVLKELNVSKFNSYVLKDNNANIKKNDKINHNSKIKDINTSSKSIANTNNINHMKKKENKDSIIKKEESKVNLIKPNISLNNKQNSISKRKNKINGNLMNSNRKPKMICCLFVNKKNNQMVLNKIYDLLSSNEYMKKQYLDKMDENYQIPSFEKGMINLIKNRILNGEEENGEK